MAKRGAEAELTRLVLLHFRDELEAALRATCREVLGSSPAPRFTVRLGGPPRKTLRPAPRPAPRDPQVASTSGTAAGEGGAGVRRLRRKGGRSYGPPAAKAKAKGD